jgi:hypothetical protein
MLFTLQNRYKYYIVYNNIVSDDQTILATVARSAYNSRRGHKHITVGKNKTTKPLGFIVKRDLSY